MSVDESDRAPAVFSSVRFPIAASSRRLSRTWAAATGRERRRAVFCWPPSHRRQFHWRIIAAPCVESENHELRAWGPRGVCPKDWTNAWRRSGSFPRPPGWEGPRRDTSSGLAPKAEPRNEILLPRWTSGLPSGLVPSHRASHSRATENGLAEPIRTATAPAAAGFRSVAETFRGGKATRPGGRTQSAKQPPHRDLGSNRVEERVREAPGGKPFPKSILTSQSPRETVRTRKAADSDDFEGLSVRGESGLPNPQPRPERLGFCCGPCWRVVGQNR